MNVGELMAHLAGHDPEDYVQVVVNIAGNGYAVDDLDVHMAMEWGCCNGPECVCVNNNDIVGGGDCNCSDTDCAICDLEGLDDVPGVWIEVWVPTGMAPTIHHLDAPNFLGGKPINPEGRAG